MKPDTGGNDGQYLGELHRHEVALSPAERLPDHHDEHCTAGEAELHLPLFHPRLCPRDRLSTDFPDDQGNQHGYHLLQRMGKNKTENPRKNIRA